jgi:hypothetical protein
MQLSITEPESLSQGALWITVENRCGQLFSTINVPFTAYRCERSSHFDPQTPIRVVWCLCKNGSPVYQMTFHILYSAALYMISHIQNISLA